MSATIPGPTTAVLKTHLGGDAPGLDHGILLPGYGFLPLYDIVLAGLAIDLLELGSLGIDALAAHLARHYRTLESHDAEVVAVGGLDYHHVPYLDVLSGGIGIDALARILETDLEKTVIHFLGDALQPVIVLELAASLTVGAHRLSASRIAGYGAATVAIELYRLVIYVVHH